MGVDPWARAIVLGLENPKMTGDRTRAEERDTGRTSTTPRNTLQLGFLRFVNGLLKWFGRCKLCGLRQDDDNEEGAEAEADHLVFQEMVVLPIVPIDRLNVKYVFIMIGSK